MIDGIVFHGVINIDEEEEEKKKKFFSTHQRNLRRIILLKLQFQCSHRGINKLASDRLELSLELRRRKKIYIKSLQEIFRKRWRGKNCARLGKKKEGVLEERIREGSAFFCLSIFTFESDKAQRCPR